MKNLLIKLLTLLVLSGVAFGTTTVTPTNFNTIAVGPKTTETSANRIAKGSDGLLRVVISDTPGGIGSVIFVHCLSADCSSRTTHTIYSGQQNSCIDASTDNLKYSLSMFGDLPRIAIQSFSTDSGCYDPTQPNAEGVGLITCLDQNCASNSFTYIGQGEEDAQDDLQSVTTPTDTTYVVYADGLIQPHHVTENIKMSACVSGSCGASSVVAFADSRNGPCILPSPVRLGVGNIPILAYTSSGNSGTVNTADCSGHLNVLHFWANGSDTILSSNALGFFNVGGLAVDSSGKPTLVTVTSTSFLSNDWHESIFHCSDSACAGVTEVDYPVPVPFSSNGSFGAFNDTIAPDGFARMAITYGTTSGGIVQNNFLTEFRTCTNVSCSASTTTTVVSNDSSHPIAPLFLSMLTVTNGSGAVVNNFAARVANCTASALPTCTYSTASEVLYQISESTPDFLIAASPAIQFLIP